VATKQEILDEIAYLVGAPIRDTSRGSTESKESLLDAAERLGVSVNPDLSKPEIAEAIARAAGIEWDVRCDSRRTPSGGGGTVTLEGLTRVRDATLRLLSRPPC
jgi:hypothetical protein